MNFEEIVHFIIGLLQVALLIAVLRQLRAKFDWYGAIAAAVLAGLVYDNFILSFGHAIGYGPTLRTLNAPRFFIHALLTPTMIIFGFGLARIAGLKFAQSKLWHAVFCIIATLMIIMGSLQDIFGLTLEPYAADDHLAGYRNTYVLVRGPPIPAVLTIVMLIIVGGLLLWRTRWPWLLVCSVLMFFGAMFGLRTPLLANLGELALGLGVAGSYLGYRTGAAKSLLPPGGGPGHSNPTHTSSPTKPPRVSSRDLELQRKNSMRLANLALGWLVFGGAVIATIDSNPGLLGMQVSPSLANLGKSIFFIGIFLHAFAAVYVYGLPILKPNLRVIDLYTGMAVFIVILANRSLVNVPALANITWLLMWIPIGIHVLLGLWFAMQRLIGKAINPRLKYYLGGNVVHDATA